jgi:protoporphyrin/coproporphyrin ferrochelatase
MNHHRADVRRGVILLAHGAPSRLGDIPAFLRNVRSGRPLPAAALEEITERYRLISTREGAEPGEASPLTRLTLRQAAALQERMGLPVLVGMRNWSPYIAEAVRQAAEQGLDHVTAICLAPQNSRTSVGLYRQHLEDARQKVAPGLAIDFIESWHDHPGLIVALFERLKAVLKQAGSPSEIDGATQVEAGASVPVIFTAHSVPERTIRDGDPYADQVRRTASLVAEAAEGHITAWSVAFQSQGMTPEPWIGPTVESEIDRWAAAGHRRLVVAPVGFVCDHVEVLYDIDIVFRDHAQQKGITIFRPESLNDSPLFIEALADLVDRSLHSQGASAQGEQSLSASPSEQLCRAS